MIRPLLLLVDFQRDFLDRPGMQPASGALVSRAALVLEAFRLAGLPVMHLRTTVRQNPDNRMRHWKQSGRWACVAGTSGHEAPGELREREGETVLHKQGFSMPGLAGQVLAHGVDGVVTCGVMMHACVRQAVLDLHQADLPVLVVEDATGSDDPLHAAITRRFLEERSIKFALAAGCLYALKERKGFLMDSPLEDGVSAAVASALRFAPFWRDLPFTRRASAVDRLAEHLASDTDSLARLIAGEIGKPLRFGRMEVSRTVEMAGAVVQRLTSGAWAVQNGPAEVRRQPHGVVAVITPWNNPVYLALGKILPAVLCGNTVVWKPSPEAGEISRRLARLLEHCFGGETVVALVEGDGRVARALMVHPGVDAVTITASVSAGCSAAETCARRGVPLQAELGGNNAAIVWADADLPAAAAKVAAGAFEMAGQRCTANRRVIVDASCREVFLELLEAETARLAWGDPLDPCTQVGPLINQEHRLRVAGVLERAAKSGCGIIQPHGAEVPPEAGWEGSWLAPAIVACEDPCQEIVQEETFGPVLVVQTARNWDHAMTLCNGVRQGLAAAVFSGSRDRIGQFLKGARAGLLKVNSSTADAAVDVPFGGWKASGAGPPEHGEGDLEFYTRVQSVYF